MLVGPSHPHSWHAPYVFLLFENSVQLGSSRIPGLTLVYAIQKCFHRKRSALVAVHGVRLSLAAVWPVCTDKCHRGLGSHGVLQDSGLYS